MLVDMFAIRYANGVIVRWERIRGAALRVAIVKREAIVLFVETGPWGVWGLGLFNHGGQSRDLEWSNRTTSFTISHISGHLPAGNAWRA